MGLDASFFPALLAHRRVAVVGVAKNCGKTTTLNFLLRRAALSPAVVGLVSIGIDGESRDVLLGTAKPSIHVQPGQWVATARHALNESGARIEYVESLGFDTPLGEVFLGRVMSEGSVILAGLRHRSDLDDALVRLEKHGVEFILIDGAYGRVMGGHSDIARAVVFSTGAVVGTSPEQIISKTEELMSRWELATVTEPRHRKLIEEALLQDRALLGDGEAGPIALPARSALLGLARARGLWQDTTDSLAVPGLVSEGMIEELLTLGSIRRTLIVACPTSIHVEDGLWRRFMRKWDVLVLRSSAIGAISFNPTSLQGHKVNEPKLRDLLAKRWPNLPIFNPMSEDWHGSSNGETST